MKKQVELRVEKGPGVELPSFEDPEFELPMKSASRQEAPCNPHRSTPDTLTWRVGVVMLSGTLDLTMVGDLVFAIFIAIARTDLPPFDKLTEMRLHEPCGCMPTMVV